MANPTTPRPGVLPTRLPDPPPPPPPPGVAPSEKAPAPLGPGAVPARPGDDGRSHDPEGKPLPPEHKRADGINVPSPVLLRWIDRETFKEWAGREFDVAEKSIAPPSSLAPFGG